MAWLGALAFCAPTLAQQSVRDDAQRLLDEQRARIREEALSRPIPQIKAPEESVSATKHPAELVETERTFPVRAIRLNGERVLTQAEQAAIVSPFIGLNLGPKRIDLLLRKLTDTYIQRGYVTTRAYLAPQNLSSGELEITVVPGTIEEVVIDGQPNTKATGTIWPLAVGDSLQLANIEQTVDQINRLRSRRAEAAIQPGQSPGSSVISLDTHPEKPWRLTTGIDNYGQQATGINRRRLGAEADNVLGLWDSWAVTDVEAAHTNSQLLAVSVPFGYGTISYAYAHGYSRIALIDNILSRTETVGHTLGWNQVIARNANFRQALDLTLVLRDSQRHIDDIALKPQQQTVARLAANTLWRGQRASLSVELGYSRGLHEFGGDGDVANLPSDSPHFEFEKWDANLSLAWSFSDELVWRALFSGQTASVGLPGSDQIYLGGAASVRGFKEGLIAGDRGALLRNELQWSNALPKNWAGGGWRFEPYAFWDYGFARHLAATSDQRLSSLGLGIRAAWKGLSTDLILGHPVQAPPDVPKNNLINFSVTLQL